MVSVPLDDQIMFHNTYLYIRRSSGKYLKFILEEVYVRSCSRKYSKFIFEESWSSSRAQSCQSISNLLILICLVPFLLSVGEVYLCRWRCVKQQAKYNKDIVSSEFVIRMQRLNREFRLRCSFVASEPCIFSD